MKRASIPIQTELKTRSGIRRRTTAERNIGRDRPTQTAEELFRIGYSLDQKGHGRAAEVIYQNAISFLETRRTAHNGELSEEKIAATALDHGKSLYSLGRFELSRAALHEAIERCHLLLQGNVGSCIPEKLALAFRALGMTQLKLGDIQRAQLCFQRSIAVWRGMLLFLPAGEKKNFVQRHLGLTMFRCGKTLLLLNRPEQAKLYFMGADAILKLSSRTKHFTLNAAITTK